MPQPAGPRPWKESLRGSHAMSPAAATIGSEFVTAAIRRRTAFALAGDVIAIVSTEARTPKPLRRPCRQILLLIRTTIPSQPRKQTMPDLASEPFLLEGQRARLRGRALASSSCERSRLLRVLVSLAIVV